jgi:tRNA-2-methylthio-N6-dimethylallyladenosine synthase
LLGQNVNSYGKGLDEDIDLVGLLERLEDIDGLWRVRYVTSHPRDVTDDLLDATSALGKVCEHIHMPAQAGSDRILERMNRRYTRDDYLRKVARAKRLDPPLAIASDFIVGFPGETDTDFQRTADLMRQAAFQNRFIFKYSPRPGTRAADLEDDVPTSVKKERNQVLLGIQEDVNRRRNTSMIGQGVEILVEGPSKNDSSRLTGRTRRNDIVVFEGPPECTGRLVEVRIEDCTPLTLSGALCRKEQYVENQGRHL